MCAHVIIATAQLSFSAKQMDGEQTLPSDEPIKALKYRLSIPLNSTH